MLVLITLLQLIFADADPFRQITPDDYVSFTKDKTVSHLVFYWSPGCHWCKVLRNDLVTLSKEVPSVDIVELNCYLYKTFCSTQRASNIPKLYLVQGPYSYQCYDRDIPLMKEFLLSHLKRK
ncbi:hypothetical protein EIN_173980 [Entamoeba invadens IP1]|uniref:Thioredoxin domain-containing protein n=1 Tax=Entamoeba invadens IP1 TaxID=370355 RepID=A0A0A1U1E2_ENTIV|nr:hypothetical protein EIN_173980 [Entamoeba invadens IP1]ELP84723.1 hypothetical protein EIN_173980 [Entamoeba invadens IP1]|eukprot:XP_004184069.1 hypothetical protein EIN_173980 [Entamoeba invadens IP1]